MSDRKCAACQHIKSIEDFHKGAKYCKTCKSQYDASRYHKNPSKYIEYQQALRHKDIKAARYRDKQAKQTLREKLLAAYGNKCRCCGESIQRFLTLDHIHGGGSAHYRTLGSTVAVYRSVLKEGCPKDKYQVLCYNCNLGRAHNGGICPHQETQNGEDT